MEDFIYVVALAGKDVFHDFSIQHTIKSMSDLDKSRSIIKEKTGLEFEERTSHFFNGYWKFYNITDNRDVCLIVERVSIVG